METPEYPALAGHFVVVMRRNFPRLVGRTAYDRALELLPENQRDEILSTTSVGWLPITTLDAFHYAVAEATGRDAIELTRELVDLNIQDTIRGVWRIAVKAATDRMLINKAPTFYSRSYNMGEATSRLVGDRHAEMTITGWPGMSPFTLPSLDVAIVRLLEHAGRRDVSSDAELTPDGGRIELRWR